MYMYLFSRAVVSSMVEVPRAFHGAELGFVFEASPVWYVVGPDQPAFDTWASEADQDLAEQIVGYWTRFAATGDPNGSEAPTWPRYTAASDAYLELGDEVAAHEGFKAERCDFWLPHMLPQ